MSADDDRLASIEQRLAAATPGPWRKDGSPLRTDSFNVRGLPENTSYDYRGDAVAVTGDSEFGACNGADAALIAHAPDDLRWLIDRLREAEAERDDARADADARFAHSDHKAAKFYRRWREAEKVARLAEESEAGWRRDADEAHAALARVEALADEWEREFRKAGYQGTLPPSITELRAAIQGESC